MSIDSELQARSGGKCELCESTDTLNAFVFQTIYFMDSTKQQILYVNIMKKELVADVLLKDKQSLNNSINFLRHCRGDRFEVYYNIKNDKIEKYNIFW